MSDRAIRRHHKSRMKAKARQVAGVVWGYAKNGQEREDIINRTAKNCDNLKACSCAMCGNPRRYESAGGKTRKELQANRDLRLAAAAIVALLALLITATAHAVEPNPLGTPPPLGLTSRAVVDRVIDGDTVDLSLSIKVRVRLLDCWAPETHGATRAAGNRATAALESLLPVGSDVVLHVPTEDATSLGSVLTFGRALGHVWQAGSDRTVSALMVAGGYATEAKP